MSVAEIKEARARKILGAEYDKICEEIVERGESTIHFEFDEQDKQRDYEKAVALMGLCYTSHMGTLLIEI